MVLTLTARFVCGVLSNTNAILQESNRLSKWLVCLNDAIYTFVIWFKMVLSKNNNYTVSVINKVNWPPKGHKCKHI